MLKLSVIAHSMGGLVAVKAALEEPLLFEGVRCTEYHMAYIPWFLAFREKQVHRQKVPGAVRE